jgi:hypothetical protein
MTTHFVRHSRKFWSCQRCRNCCWLSLWSNPGWLALLGSSFQEGSNLAIVMTGGDTCGRILQREKGGLGLKAKKEGGCLFRGRFRGLHCLTSFLHAFFGMES